MKKILFALIAFILAFNTGSYSQSAVEDFSRAANNDGSVGSSVLRNMTGQTGSGSWKVNSDSTASPYNSGGTLTYGAMYCTTPITGANGVEVSFVIKARSSNNNQGDIAIILANDSNLTTADGYMLRMVEITGSDRLDIRSFSNNNFPTGGGSGSGATVSLEFAVGDTIRLVLYPDGRKTSMRKTAAGVIDSCSTTLTAFNLSGTIYAGIHGAVYAAPEFKIDHFTVYPLSAGGGGGGGTPDVTPPVALDPSPTPANPTAGSAFSVSFDWTENIATSTTRIDSSPTGGAPWTTVNTLNYTAASQTRSGRHTTASITYASPDSVWFRGIVTDTAGNADTTAAVKVTIGTTAPPPTSSYTKRSVVYLYCAATRINVPGAPGAMPIDSVMWGLYTHATIFAPAVNATGTGFSNQTKYAPYMSYFPAIAHANNVKIGITIGGWGGSDAVIAAMENNPAGFANFLAQTIQTYQLDFIDFDLEGGVFNQAKYTASVKPWFDRFYDTLQNYSAGWNASYKPTIVLTISPGYNAAWGSTLLPSEPKLDFVQLMSYDKASAWSGTVLPDMVPISRNSANQIVLRVTSSPTSQEFPSLEASAVMLTGTGFPANKVVVGFDFMGETATGGTYPTDTTMYPFRPYTTAPTYDNAAPFYTFYPNHNANITPRIQFHQTGKFYWSYYDAGAGTTGDYFYHMGAYPGGYDSSIYYSFDLVNRKGLGGIMYWDLGEAWLNTGTDKNWMQRSIQKYISMLQDSTKQKLSPPSLTSPANNATGVATNPTLDFGDVTGSTEFWVQVASDQNFTTIVVSDSNFTISQRAVSGLTNGTQYWWRVATQNANGFGAFSAPWTFTVVPSLPGTPTLLFPANAATGQSATVSLSWQAASGAASYKLQVDSVDNIFSNLMYNVTGVTTTNYTVNLRTNKTYYWRVRATNGAGDGSYSGIFSFTTANVKPAQPVLISPANGLGSQDTNNLPIVWGVAAGASTYRLQVDDVSTFASPFKDTTTASLSKNLWGLASGTKYFWRVQSYSASDSSGWTPAWDFTTTVPAQNRFPALSGQFPYVYDISAGAVVVNQPPRFFGMKRGSSDMSDVPEPPDTTYDYLTLDGILQKGRVVKPLSGSTSSGKMTAQEIWDSLKTLGALSGAKFISPTILQDYKVRANDSAATVTVAPPTQQTNVSVALPSFSGQMPVKDNLAEGIYVGSVASDQPIDWEHSGGLGTNRANASATNTGGYVYIDPTTGDLNQRTSVPYTDLSGVPAAAGGADGQIADEDTVFHFLEDFTSGGLGTTSSNDNIAGDGTPLVARPFGSHNWRGYGFGTLTTPAVRLGVPASTSMNDFGLISLEADTAVTLGTARGGYITLGGSNTTHSYPLMDTGLTYKTRIYTPNSTDSLGWFAGVVRKTMASPSATQGWTTEEGIFFEYGKTPFTTNDTLYAVVMGAADAVNRYALQTVTGNTWYKLKYVVSTTDIKFYVNGVLKATATTGLPATTDYGTPAVGIWTYDKTATGNSRRIYVDYVSIKTTVSR